MTPAQLYAYANFFARAPATIAFVGVMGFWIEYLMQRGAK